MNIVIINASPRKEGRVATLVEEVARSLADKGAQVEHLRLADLKIGYCRFCMGCYRDPDSPIGKCILDDDMQWILPKLKAADGYVMATQVSSGHANAIFKTFFERCAYTAGSSKGKILWMKGIPVSRFTDRRRFAVTIATAGTIPTWLRMLCDTATGQMKELADCALNAKVIGTLYAGEQTFKGLKDSDRRKARKLGEDLVAAINSQRG
jgi:hypothetical protein